ncbi:MAG: hypothetical protein D6689_14920 [Deltaproteobacteria bacterium]|nr:MAG: hypothetical protein D6689_14920 [Deltaproteobacteria bacterium]
MSSPRREQRRALRIAVHIPTLIEPVGQPALRLHDDLAAVYERVAASTDRIGDTLPGVVRDLSTNGAFIACEPLPLLSRVAFTFPLDGFGQVEAIAWTLWRRREDCTIPGPDGTPVDLPRGFGVLFEAIPLDARMAIHELVSRAARAPA